MIYSQNLIDVSDMTRMQNKTDNKLIGMCNEMSTPKMLMLFDKICEDRGRVLDLARIYVADDVKTFHSAEECVLVKDGKNIEFDRIEDFNTLRDKIKEIEEAKNLKPCFFEIQEDIEKIRFLINKKILIPASNVEKQPNAIVDEAKRILSDAHKYIFVACSEKGYLDQRFEIFRIKHLLSNENDYDFSRNDDDLNKILKELEKIRFFFKEKMVVSIDEIQEDYEKLDNVFNIIDKLDRELYSEGDYPNRKMYRALFIGDDNYDKKCNFIHKTIMQDIPRLFSRVRQNCAKFCLDPGKRLQMDKSSLNKKMETQIFQLETAFLNKKEFNKYEFIINEKYRFDVFQKDIHSRMSKNKTIKGLKEKYSIVLKELDRDIVNIINNDKKRIDDSMLIMNETEEYILNNIKSFKFRKR